MTPRARAATRAEEGHRRTPESARPARTRSLRVCVRRGERIAERSLGAAAPSELAQDVAGTAAEARVHHGVEDRAEGVAEADEQIVSIVGSKLAQPQQDLVLRNLALDQGELVANQRSASAELEGEPAKEPDVDLPIELEPVLLEVIEKPR